MSHFRSDSESIAWLLICKKIVHLESKNNLKSTPLLSSLTKTDFQTNCPEMLFETQSNETMDTKKRIRQAKEEEER